jgi:hypothetical protein
MTEADHPQPVAPHFSAEMLGPHKIAGLLRRIADKGYRTKVSPNCNLSPI